MPTTVDLPDAVASAIKRRAAQEGRALDAVVADLLRAGLAPAGVAETGAAVVETKNLPLIKVRPAPPAAGRALSLQEWCAWIKAAELRLDVEQYEKALGHQHVDRADPGDAPPSRPRA